MIASNSSLHFDGNLYGLHSREDNLNGKWSYAGRMFQGFADYQAHSNQDAGSTFRRIVASNTDLEFWPKAGAEMQQSGTTHEASVSQSTTDSETRAELRQHLTGRWTMYATLSGEIDVNGLLNETSRRQLGIVKSLTSQFHGNGLKTLIALYPERKNTSEYRHLENAISDLDFKLATFVDARGTSVAPSKVPLILFLSPEGHVIKDWHGFAGAAELGIAVRQKLGDPAFSQMGEIEP